MMHIFNCDNLIARQRLQASPPHIFLEQSGKATRLHYNLEPITLLALWEIAFETTYNSSLDPSHYANSMLGERKTLQRKKKTCQVSLSLSLSSKLQPYLTTYTFLP